MGQANLGGGKPLESTFAWLPGKGNAGLANFFAAHGLRRNGPMQASREILVFGAGGMLGRGYAWLDTGTPEALLQARISWAPSSAARE